MSEPSYRIGCDCGTVQVTLTGSPRVRGHCHCNACRILLDTPYHSVTAWMPEQVDVTAGSDSLVSFQHPDLSMKKIFCRDCGTTLWNTNKMDWRVVSQHLIAKRLGGLPDELQSLSHFHYGARIVDVDDDLPKKD
ncbi:GFA family protein [Oceanomicrobium pacificus]|uniref:Aldehyde-activating protein n=1 Tax=Oceanomicrobium pacificus TaxID=2692916 RepID=A0A6B0TMU4_9RHOB|nr:GFA family protein [Oceanomicrobium pacificus]MXU65847.1 aldehyde-activating protein [Oceanomicrobium pacificus]